MKIQSLFASTTLAVAVTAASAQLKQYNIETPHSEADFSIKHMAISTIHRGFHGVTGVI